MTDDLRSELEKVIARAYGNTNIIGFRSEKVSDAILARFVVAKPEGVDPGLYEMGRQLAGPWDQRKPVYLRPLSDKEGEL